MLRLFVALDLKNDEVRERISLFQRRILSSGADLKAVDPKILHLTLKFLGEVPDASVHQIAEALSSLSRPKFDLHFKGVGVFPSMGRMNVIWVGAEEGSKDFVQLALTVRSALKNWGLDDRPPSPHLTIFRVRSPKNRDELGRIILDSKNEDFGTVHFDEFQLKSSELRPAGPVYTDIQTFRLV
jgi:2'-5' RNA ligase